MSPTQPMSLCDDVGRCFIQKQPELDDSSDVVGQAYHEDNYHAAGRFQIVALSLCTEL